MRGLFLLTNKKLESAVTCGFQTKFKQIAPFDALLKFFAILTPSVGENMSLIHGEHSFSQSVCGGHYAYSYTRTLCFCTETFIFVDLRRISIKSSIIGRILGDF